MSDIPWEHQQLKWERDKALASLDNLHSALLEKITALEVKLAARETDVDALNRTACEYRDEMEAAEAKLAATEAEMLKFQQARNTAWESEQSLKTERDDLQEKIAYMGKIEDHLIGTNKDFAKDIDDLRAEVDALKESLNLTGAKLAEARDEWAKTSLKLMDTLAQRDAALARVNGDESGMGLRDRLAFAEASRDAALAKVAELETRLDGRCCAYAGSDAADKRIAELEEKGRDWYGYDARIAALEGALRELLLLWMNEHAVSNVGEPGMKDDVPAAVAHARRVLE